MKLPQLVLGALLALASAHAAALGRLADISIYDRTERRPLPILWHQGRAWVAGKPGNEYQITVRSRRGEDLLAVISVDGVNVVTGETASPHQSGYVLDPWRGLELRGWRKDLSRTAAFYFTRLADSYAARTGRPDEVGAIGVALFQRRKPEPRVDLAPLSRALPEAQSGRAESAAPGAARDSRVGTGHGRIEASPARQVAFERATPHPAETIVLYYDSVANLQARGVLPAPPPPIAPLPRPFPGFVPDPPA